VRFYSDGLEPHNARGGSAHIEKLQKMGSPSPIIYAQKQGSWLSMESSQRITLSGTSSKGVPPGLHRVDTVRCNNLPTVLCTHPWMQNCSLCGYTLKLGVKSGLEDQTRAQRQGDSLDITLSLHANLQKLKIF
jgi:hypothetical protein